MLTTMLTATLAAAVVGLAVAWWMSRQQRDDAQVLIDGLRGELLAQQQQAAEHAAVARRDDLQHAIQALVAEADRQVAATNRTGVAELDGRKALIDAELQRMGTTLGQVVDLVRTLESERADQLGQVREQLQGVTRTHAQLAATTGAIREALTSSQARGQWGERMAEDVLTAAGFKHGVNYVTQRTLASGSRPDVTFLLPGELCLHMDVKFPLANYLAMLECDGESDREQCRKAFLRDVRGRVKELAIRGYVDPDAGTLDFVVLFLPNEHVYGYVHEQDPTLLDDALRQGVVMCSPSTLFAVLAVVRQACDGVALQRTSDQIVALLSGFTQQWGRYTDEVDKLGRQLDTVRRTYDGLATTRRRQLERQLERIEEVREERGVLPATVDDRPRLLRLPDPTGPSGPGVDRADDEGGAADEHRPPAATVG
ncbi:DNA recombination protein RmuC [Egicoccus sp. AB-alg6-2]|uniref:DNA recombination protein RmuC n=1 Tax=Egicoccus sp. AB-alg6-2 TaxID=3242692 RepID=UPI00359D0D51